MAYHRTFVAINLSEKAKKSIAESTRDWQDWPVKWTDERNLHLTLVFLGDVTEDEVFLAGEKIKEAASRAELFVIRFTDFIYGPKDFSKTIHPRMIWLEGTESEELVNLQYELEKALGMSENKNKKRFRPHITVGRVKTGNDVELKRLPEEIDKKLELIVPVSSIEFMESVKPGGPRYTVLLSAKFGVE